MALNASKVAGGNGGNRVEQEALEAGTYPARLVQVLDLGLQPQRPYQGQEKPPMNEIMLTYELADEFMKDEDGNDIEDKPRWQSEIIPLHNLKADKAKSTKRYEALDPNGNYGGDFSQCVDTPVNVTLVQNKSADGKIYVNVAGITSMRSKDAQKAPELKNPPKVFDLDAPDLEIFGSLPEWVQEKIKKNLNYQGSPLQVALEGGEKPKKKEEAPQQEDNDDDKPW